MQFYKKTNSGKRWKRKTIFSIFIFLRDSFLYLLPPIRLPKFIVKTLYGVNPKFVFFVHPRRLEDAYIALPFLSWIRRIFGKKVFANILKMMPPLSISTIKTPQGIEGLIVSSSVMPEFIIKDREIALKECVKGLHFTLKVTQECSVFGLGAFWPMMTKRGLLLQRYQKKRGIIITNGHCGTLVSIFLTIKKMARLANLSLNELKIAILGVGKMGTNLAQALYGKVATITLIDVSEERLNKIEKKLKMIACPTDIQKYTNKEDLIEIKDMIANNHITVCTTSNLKRILKPHQIPKNTIIIDDSRPEAISRDLNYEEEIAILEGGLLKIDGIEQQYNFGFGIDENVFGCMGETFLMAADGEKNIKPTLGEVDFDNFRKMIAIHKKLGVEVGDFKCREETISNKKITSILNSKNGLSATIPFKKICWILKTDNLSGL